MTDGKPVEENPPTKAPLSVVKTAQGEMEALTFKSALEAAGIPAFLKLDTAAKLYGITVDGVGAVEILVPTDRLEEAEAILGTTAQPLDDEDGTA